MRLFGLIGKPLSHSFSKNYFSKKFIEESIKDANYELFPLESINELSSLLEKQKDLIGFNVTIPYKESVIPFLDELDVSAQEIGAVNTVFIKRENDRAVLKGYNTDAIGFRDSIKPFLASHHDRALIFGSGGSSKAVAHVLQQLQIPFHFVSRNPSLSKEIAYTDIDEQGIHSTPLLINCTPLGMSPNVLEMIPIPITGISSSHLVYDLIYNPEETLLLKEAKERGAIAVNGYSMLKLQAEASWKIWNNH